MSRRRDWRRQRHRMRRRVASQWCMMHRTRSPRSKSAVERRLGARKPTSGRTRRLKATSLYRPAGTTNRASTNREWTNREWTNREWTNRECKNKNCLSNSFQVVYRNHCTWTEAARPSMHKARPSRHKARPSRHKAQTSSTRVPCLIMWSETQAAHGTSPPRLVVNYNQL